MLAALICSGGADLLGPITDPIAPTDFSFVPETMEDSRPTMSRSAPGDPVIIIQSMDYEEDYDDIQNDFAVLLCGGVAFTIVGLGALLFCRRRVVDDNQEGDYTRAIIEDGGFEFDTLDRG
jgi:hypothetical protein